MPGVAVRTLESSSLDAVEALEPPSRRYVRGAFERQLRGDHVVLVAWVGDEPVGSGELTSGPRPEVRNLAVRAAYRGRGIGTSIIAAAEAAARDRAVLRVGVATDNPGARRLHERLGFLPTGEIEEYEYTYVDDDDRTVTERETSEYLEKSLLAR